MNATSYTAVRAHYNSPDDGQSRAFAAKRAEDSDGQLRNSYTEIETSGASRKPMGKTFLFAEASKRLGRTKVFLDIPTERNGCYYIIE